VFSIYKNEYILYCSAITICFSLIYWFLPLFKKIIGKKIKLNVNPIVLARHTGRIKQKAEIQRGLEKD
jgi:hypothetical protein